MGGGVLEGGESRNVAQDLDIHIVMDDASSRITQVERFFALLAEKQIKRGAPTSVNHLVADILASIERFCQRTLEAHPGAAADG